MNELEPCSVVWKECGGDGLAERFFVPGFKGSLPFFISGPELLAMENGEDVELNERQLLEGILYGLYEFDHATKPWHDPESRHTLTYLLDVLGNGFGFDSPEALLLNCAAGVRERNGSIPSRIILLNGLELVPFSSKIRSDLICDTWVVAAMDNNLKLIEPIPDWVMETTLSELIQAAKENICYYGLCSLILQEEPRDDEIVAFLEDFVYPNVEQSILKAKISDLLSEPNEFLIKDLELT